MNYPPINPSGGWTHYSLVPQGKGLWNAITLFREYGRTYLQKPFPLLSSRSVWPLLDLFHNSVYTRKAGRGCGKHSSLSMELSPLPVVPGIAEQASLYR